MAADLAAWEGDSSHLSPEGRIEACPFAPFSDREVATTSLEHAPKIAPCWQR